MALLCMLLCGTCWKLNDQQQPPSPCPCLCPAEVSQLRWEASSLDFLRKEIGRLRKVRVHSSSCRLCTWPQVPGMIA